MLFAQRRLGQFIASHNQDPTQEVLMFAVKSLLADSLHSMQAQDAISPQDEEPLFVKDLAVDTLKQMVRDIVSKELLKASREASKAPESMSESVKGPMPQQAHNVEGIVSARETHEAPRTGDATRGTFSRSMPAVSTNHANNENTESFENIAMQQYPERLALARASEAHGARWQLTNVTKTVPQLIPNELVNTVQKRAGELLLQRGGEGGEGEQVLGQSGGDDSKRQAVMGGRRGEGSVTGELVVVGGIRRELLRQRGGEGGQGEQVLGQSGGDDSKGQAVMGIRRGEGSVTGSPRELVEREQHRVELRAHALVGGMRRERRPLDALKSLWSKLLDAKEESSSLRVQGRGEWVGGGRERDKEKKCAEAEKRRAFEAALEKGEALYQQAMLLLQDIADKGLVIRD